VLLRHGPNLAFAEPFEGLTPLHAHAREGYVELAATLLEMGAPGDALNDAGRTPLDEAVHELQTLEAEDNITSVGRRVKLKETIEAMRMFLSVL
jgi:ankyrin repeat protein